MLASDTNETNAVCGDMRIVKQVCTENRILNTIFANPTIREGKKVAILNDLFGEKLTRTSMAFLTFVARKRRSVNLKGIANAFIEMYRNENNIILSNFVTATEADDETKRKVSEVVETYTGKKVELETKVDDSIIGGFSVTFDNNMYDARISSYITKLRKEFSVNDYESKL